MSRSKSSRKLLGLALAASATGIPTVAIANLPQVPQDEAQRVATNYAAGIAALMQGDASTYLARIGGLTDDFLLMSPFGGKPSVAADYTPEKIERMGRFFRNGTFKQQVLATYASPDMIVLATIESGEVEVAGLPRQKWPLRVTSVFVRSDEGWQLAHRHADPLVAGISLERAASLARGEQ